MEMDIDDRRAEEIGVGKQLGYPSTSFQSGSCFKGYQQSKGNKYHVDVIIQVGVSLKKR